MALCTGLLACLPLAGLAQDGPSTDEPYGCRAYEYSAALPSVQGKDGVFFRTFADLRLQHPMDDRTIAQMGHLAKVLAENGTTLVYVTIPAKSQAMADYLPAHAADYGFDSGIAEDVYNDITSRLRSAGIVAPDMMAALQGASGNERAFFGADFHWTSEGARLGAMAIGEAIKADPAYADLTPQVFVSTPVGREVAFSGMRRTLQGFCTESLPPTETTVYKTEAVASADDAGGALDIFAGQSDTLSAVLVGTSFSDSPINNFGGFISEYTGLDLVNYAITGGNQYGAITSYLTSDEFKDQRPRFLIWENPIYNNLAQYGSAAMEELIAAAGGSCTVPLDVTQIDDTTVEAALDTLKIGPQDAIFADFGAEGARVADFVLTTTDGIDRHAKIERGARLRGTGNFYLGMGPYRHPGFASVRVSFDRPVTSDTSLTFCPTIKGDAS